MDKQNYIIFKKVLPEIADRIRKYIRLNSNTIAVLDVDAKWYMFTRIGNRYWRYETAESYFLKQQGRIKDEC